MPTYRLIQEDIVNIKADALVNAANTSLLAGGDQGVNGAIHKAGGDELFEACKMIRIRLGEVPVGEAIPTPAGNLSASFVIHAVGPVWKGGKNEEHALLAKVYQNALKQAETKEVKSIAIPNISTGIYGFPKEQAAEIAISNIKEYFRANPDSKIEEVIFVCRNQENLNIYKGKLEGELV